MHIVALDRLRSATREAHRQLEGELDVVGRLAADDRWRLVGRYHALYSEADALLGPWLAGVPGLDRPARSRADHAAHDLQDLGHAGAPGRPAAAVEIASLAEALGFLYVIEGSALGGRVILRELSARGAPSRGLSFLDPHGARAGEAWRGFLGVLEREVAGDEAMIGQAVAGAAKGFAHARACLSEAPAAT